MLGYNCRWGNKSGDIKDGLVLCICLDGVNVYGDIERGKG